ncbi:MAG: hypothetical protein SGCHY_002376 [Lobulomycetales sp.]
MAVVLPDIMPLEGEFVGKELLLHLFRLNIIAPGNVLLISNRNDIRSLLGPEFRICATLKRMDESLVTYSLIVFTSNTLYLGLSIEPIRNISFSPATVFMATNTSLSVEKIMQMFHPNSAIPFNYRADTAEGKDQATFWIPQDLENEWVLPDIDLLKSTIEKFSEEMGIEDKVIKESIIPSVIPQNPIKREAGEIWQKRQFSVFQ